jgi:hypothetical protein
VDGDFFSISKMGDTIASNSLKSDKVNSGIEKKNVGKEKKLWAHPNFF